MTNIELTEQMRQEESESDFKYFLSKVRNNHLDGQDVDYINDRCISGLRQRGQDTFDDALYLFYTRASVDKHNIESLTRRKLPTYLSEAVHRGSRSKAVKNVDSDVAGGLDDEVLLAIGARVMLRANLWTSVGLVNGALGSIVDVWLGPESPLPIAVFVRFDNYVGPTYDGKDGSVPILPIERFFTAAVGGKSVSLSRKQVPLHLAYATTIHKSLGLTLKKVCADLTGIPLGSSLAYVALSRVKRVTDLALLKTVPYHALK